MVQTETDRRMGLNLNLSIYSLPKPLSQFLDQVSRIKDNNSKLFEIDGYVGKLEEEKKKIDVFKRELPYCMLLLSEAIEMLKEEALRDVGAKLETDNNNNNNNKKNWMSSAQLWISNPNSQSTNVEEVVSVSERGVFMPFHPPPPPPAAAVPQAPIQASVPLSLMTQMDCSRIESQSHVQFDKSMQSHVHVHNHNQNQKKEQRRRWSQELHRKFVDALHRLGGSQVATPKQIRELMQVDGLTNDEVKSHLQKYRMHIRKHPLHPTSDQGGLLDRESQSLISLSRSDSPQSPLVERGLFSDNVGHSSEEAEEEEEEEEEKSDGRSSWKSESKKKRRGLDLEL